MTIEEMINKAFIECRGNEVLAQEININALKDLINLLLARDKSLMRRIEQLEEKLKNDN